MEDDTELPKTLVKLRRTPSDTPRPASTPPVIAASAIQDEDEEENIIAELEVGSGVGGRLRLVASRMSSTFVPQIFQRMPVKGHNKGGGVAAVTARPSGSRARKVTFAVARLDSRLSLSCSWFFFLFASTSDR